MVHIKSRLESGETVPIGWVAVGDPVKILAPDKHEEIWKIQKPLNFPMTVYGIDRDEADMRKITERVAEALATHKVTRLFPNTATRRVNADTRLFLVTDEAIDLGEISTGR